MRVLQVSDGYPPVIGGIESYVRNLSRALLAEGHDVMVATLGSLGRPQSEVVDGITIRRLNGLTQRLPGAGHDPDHVFHPPAADPPILLQLQSLIREFRPDVIHAHGWMLHSCLLLRRGSAVLIAHLHEWGLSCVKKTMVTDSGTCRTGPALLRCPSCANQQYRGIARSGSLAFALRAARPLYRRVDGFIAISSAVAKVARGVIPFPERLSIVPTAVPDGLPEIAANSPRPPWLPDAPFALFVGVLGPHKGLNVLLHAKALSRSNLALVLLEPRADTPALGEDVIVREDIPHEQVMASWSRATIGVVPSLSEAFGQVAVECQLVGTPVIVSATGGLVDIVRNGVNGVCVPPDDAQALADAIDLLAENPTLRDRLGEAGRRSAEQFTISAVLPKILDVYERSLRQRRGQLMGVGA